jgi:hypothetical protein
MNCTECIEKLVEYIEGLLSDGQKQQLELHLKNCRQCQAELDKLIALGDRVTSDSKSKQLTDFEYAVFNRIIREQNKRLKQADGIDRQLHIWRIIMKSSITKLAVAAVLLIAAVISITFLNKSATPAYAIEQTIEALRNFGAVHMIGTVKINGQETGYEWWMEANKSKTSSQDNVMRFTNGFIEWVKDGNTYTYVPQKNVVCYENAIRNGASPWFGPAFFEMVEKLEGTKILQGKDPATGRDRITMLASITNGSGPTSLIIEFDGETKLPVAVKRWDNLDRSGQPAFEAFKITYYEEMADSLLNVQIPGEPNYVEQPLTCFPEKNIGLLGNPDDGISAEGLTQQDACGKILRGFFGALINGNLEQAKKLSPLLKNCSDEALRTLPELSGEAKIVEILEAGQICKTSNSKLGPIALASIILKHKDDTKTEEKMIVQFRNIEGKASCVLYPYAFSRDIE